MGCVLQRHGLAATRVCLAMASPRRGALVQVLLGHLGDQRQLALRLRSAVAR
jgi:hypothetical protein